MKHSAFKSAAALLILAGLGAAAGAQEQPQTLDSFSEMPAYWAVTGVRSNDVLHLRDVPSADSKSLAGIPFNAKGLKHLGCRRNEMPFEDWVKLNKEARRAALMQWCRVEYKGKQGWVAGRYLKPDETQKH
ncbi:MAG TPA: SH3 domain-containing protein [Hyphomicrobiaceae bacterium]|nr:SH3 domain-containing protein [Hyphomicrobiaceae bacterium]